MKKNWINVIWESQSTAQQIIPGFTNGDFCVSIPNWLTIIYIAKSCPIDRIETFRLLLYVSVFINFQGCESKLYDWIVDHAAVLIGIAFGLAVIQVT